MSQTLMVHTAGALVKIIDDETTVRLKICPRFEVGDSDTPEYDEFDGAVSSNLDWREINMVIERLREQRDRVFGKPA